MNNREKTTYAVKISVFKLKAKGKDYDTRTE
jgi:hypothetical protein